MLFNIKGGFSRGGAITEDSFSFTGNYLFARDEDGNWELALLESGTLNWLKTPGFVDMCLVGAGQNGGTGQVTGNYKGAYVYSGKGGDGGRILNVPGAELVGSCVIAVGSNGNETTIDNGENSWSSENGPAPKEGGRRAEMPQQYTTVGIANDSGKDGIFAYGAVSDETLIPALNGVLLGASGGGGHARSVANIVDPKYQVEVEVYTWTSEKGGKNAGGNTGAGNGGTNDHRNGYDATGYGAGGGGGFADGKTQVGSSGGAGGNGILLIRNRRN